MRTLATWVCMIGCCFPLVLSAAQSDRALSAVNQAAGELVFVERVTGGETLARVVSASDTELLVQIGGVDARIPVTEIRKIAAVEGDDSLSNGMLWGAGGGAFLGLFACQGGTERCSIAGATIGSALVFGALGAWIDHLREGRRTLYRARR